MTAEDIAWLLPLVIAGFSCLARAGLKPDDRAAWALLGTGFLFWLAGDLYYYVEPLAPYPGPTDAMYIAFYLCQFGGLGLLIRSRRAAGSALADVGITALGLACLWSLFVLEQVLTNHGLSGLALAVTAAYPLLDLALVAGVLAILAFSGWRLSAQLVALSLGFALTGIADSVYLVQYAQGTYQYGWVDWLWIAGPLIVGVAAWVPARLREPDPIEQNRTAVSAVLASIAAAAAIVVLVADHYNQVGEATASLAAATLVAAFIESIILYRTRDKAERRARREARRVVEALAVAVDAKDHHTRNHSERVAEHARKIALELGMDAARVEVLAVAGRLHDVGKIPSRTPYSSRPALSRLRSSRRSSATARRASGLSRASAWMRSPP